MEHDWPEDFEGNTWTLFGPWGEELERNVEVRKHGLGMVRIGDRDFMRIELLVSKDCRRIDLGPPTGGYLTR